MSTIRPQDRLAERRPRGVLRNRSQRWGAPWSAAVLLVCTGSSALAADEMVQRTAQTLTAATVTVRASGSQDFMTAAEGSADDDGAAPSPVEADITVCSGTYVGEGRLLSFGCLPILGAEGAVETEYRITFPAGGQAIARPRVVDHHSGLVLLQVAEDDPDTSVLAALELAESAPETGSSVLTAAAAGVEEPLVSLGVLSGIDRIVPGTELPPLLVCDISTTAASSGAAVVDREARLVGILAAASLPGEGFGWSYAIPLKHIRRVLSAQEADRLVVLPRMRPNLGVVLGPGEEIGSVVVQHVVSGGPGDRAELAAGDRILAIEGRQVRSVYQAGTILRKHLPGERITLTCIAPAAAGGNQRSREREVEVTLGAQSDAQTNSSQVDVQPQTIKARFTGPGEIELSNSMRSYQFSFGASAGPAEAPIAAPDNGLRQKLTEYEQLIQALRDEAEQTRQQLAKREQMVEALQRELTLLRKEVRQPQASGGQQPR